MPQFSTRPPSVLNTADWLSFTVPVLNLGPGDATNLTITGVGFGPAAPIGPALPFPIGDLGVNNATTLFASFAPGSLAVGGKYLASLRGTYEFQGGKFGFTLNRFIEVPDPTPPPVELLRAHVQVAVDSRDGLWSYALFNDEPLGSPFYINAISLDMAAPFVVTGTPPGWEVDTDNATYVLWYSADETPPYPSHVPPGAWLGGFQIQSNRQASQGRALIITSWDHQSDDGGPTTPGTTLTPSQD